MTEETSNNIINLFPSSTNNSAQIKTIENVQESLQNIKVLHCQETCQTVITIIMDMLFAGGFNFRFDETNKCIKESALLAETLKALLYKYYDIEHSLHDVANNYFEEVGQGIVHYKNINSNSTDDSSTFDFSDNDSETI